jgi:hypothetical protein
MVLARGRKSASQLTVIGAGGIETIARPQAPDGFSEEEAHEWTQIVNRMPADWFGRETIPLLVQYVRHVIRSRRLGEMIRNLENRRNSDDFDANLYMKLLRAEETQSRSLASLATKMRLPQQSTYDKSKRKPPNASKLWSQDY